MKRAAAPLLALALLLVAGAAVAATSLQLTIEHQRSNPNHADITLGSHDLAGIGEVGFSDHRGWVLAVDSQTASHGAYAGLTVALGQLQAPMKLNELGFDIFTPGGFDTFDRGSLCGTSLRFDFKNSKTGGVYELTCNQGTHTDRGNGWTRVRFTTDADVVTVAGPTWPGFGTGKVDAIQLLNDGAGGGGVDLIDAVDVNGTLIGK